MTSELTYNRVCMCISPIVQERSIQIVTDLVSITEWEGLCPDVLVGILNTLLQGRPMLLVFPMFIPQIFRI